jgi:uncharacterized delta-60 repeat protein
MRPGILKRHGAVALLPVAALVAAAASAQVDLDAGFGAGGVATLDLGAGSALPAGFVAAPDGSLLVAGWFTPSGQPQAGFVARMTSGGAIDGSFATGGVFKADFGGFTAITGLARQGDGKLVALANNGPYGTTAMRVLRLTAGGAPDATFSGDGVAEVGTAYAFAPIAAVVQPDGRIVVAANSLGTFSEEASALTLFRLLGDGALDTGFKSAGAAGFATATISGFDAAAALALQPDGKIVVVGSTNAGAQGNTGTRDFAVARFNANGTPDTTFAGGGATHLPVGTLDDDALAVLVQPDNRIVIAGNTYVNSSRSNCAIVRLNGDGSPDAAFGTGGIASYNLGGLSTCASLTRQGDGTLLAAGSWAANIDSIFMVMRVLPNGAPDPSFNQGTSWTYVNPTPGADTVFAHATQAGGRIVLAGSTSTGKPVLARFLAAVPDTTPDPFTFADRTNVARGSVVVSAAVAVTGIAAAAPIGVTGGEYSIDGAAFTTASGTVTGGSSVRVRHTASLQPLAQTSTTLTVDDVSDVFTSTTEPPRLRPRRVTSGP